MARRFRRLPGELGFGSQRTAAEDARTAAEDARTAAEDARAAALEQRALLEEVRASIVAYERAQQAAAPPRPSDTHGT